MAKIKDLIGKKALRTKPYKIPQTAGAAHLFDKSFLNCQPVEIVSQDREGNFKIHKPGRFQTTRISKEWDDGNWEEIN